MSSYLFPPNLESWRTGWSSSYSTIRLRKATATSYTIRRESGELRKNLDTFGYCVSAIKKLKAQLKIFIFLTRHIDSTISSRLRWNCIVCNCDMHLFPFTFEVWNWKFILLVVVRKLACCWKRVGLNHVRNNWQCGTIFDLHLYPCLVLCDKPNLLKKAAWPGPFRFGRIHVSFDRWSS